ncbi:MAG: MmgE/PrpD family protein, partial [Hyphomicrobiales bacterium]|nr:MmgE/PrpD family protein [Hyphomicrobiales bacterium]
ALTAGRLQVADIFVDRRVGNPQLAALCRKVTVTSDPELDRLFPDFYASIVDVRTVDGKTLSRRNDIARGYPEAPLTQAELDEKFRALAGSVFEPAHVEQLAAALRRLSEAESIVDYAALLRAPVKGGLA